MKCPTLPVATVALTLWLLPTHYGNAFEIVGHRGSCDEAPENTVSSFKLAWAEGADAVEFDVMPTKDGRLVVIHDKNTLRTTGVAGVVEQSDFAQVRALDAGSLKKIKYAGEKIPTLEEALATLPEKKRFFFEVKTPTDISAQVNSAILGAKLSPDQVMFTSFFRDSLAKVKRALPQYPVCGIIDKYQVGDSTKKGSPTIDELIARAKELQWDGVLLHASWPIDQTLVAKLKAAGLKTYVWTVDDPQLVGRLRDAGVDGVITNKPGWMRTQLAQTP